MRFAVAAIVLASNPLLPARAAAPAPVVPLDAFVHEDKLAHPRLAPDGKHIVLTARVPDKDRDVPVLMTFTVPGMKMSGAVRLPKFEVPLDYQWLTSNRLVVEKGSERGSRIAPVATGEVLAVDLDGSHQEYLYGYRMFGASTRGDRYGDDYGDGIVQHIPRARDGHLFLSSHAWDGSHSLLYDIDSRTAVRKLVADLPYPDLDFVVRSDGRPGYAYGADEDNKPLLFRYDAAAGKWTTLDAPGIRYRPLALSPDDRQLLVGWSPSGGPNQLAREDVASGRRSALFEDADASYAGLLAGPDRGLPFGAFAAFGAAGKPEVRLFDAAGDGARLYHLVSAQFPDELVQFIDFSDDGDTLLFSVASDRDPGSYYLFDRRTMKADLLFSAREEIDPDRMAPRRPVTFKARDGLVLHGFLTMPAHPAGSKPPLVLLPHGGPFDIDDDWFFDADAEFLASRGYAVLQVNYRGSGGRGPDFKQAGYREWGGKIQDDLVDGVRWAVAGGEVDGDRMCVYGASFGGYSALMLAAREPGLFKCAVGYAGVYDLTLLDKPQNNRLDNVVRNYIHRTVGTDPGALAAASPVHLAERIRVPVLLVHGSQDKTAPVEHAEAMRAALTQAGRPPEWFLVSGEGHGFYDTANQTAFYRRLEAFLARNLGGPR